MGKQGNGRDWKSDTHKNIKEMDGKKVKQGGAMLLTKGVKKGTSNVNDRYGVGGSWKNK